MSLPASCLQRRWRLIRDEELTGTRVLRFSSRNAEVGWDAQWQDFGFLVDGKTFDPDRVDQRVRLGAVEEWTIVNEDQDDHVFHIHTNDMQLTTINGEPLAEPIWLDTMIVPGKRQHTFRSRFVDFTGKMFSTAT